MLTTYAHALLDKMKDCIGFFDYDGVEVVLAELKTLLEMDGFDTLKLIKSNEKTKDIPIIFLTAKDDSGSEIEELRLGAVDYITKPFSIPLLLQRSEEGTTKL